MVSHFQGDSRAKKGHDLQQERRLAAPRLQVRHTQRDGLSVLYSVVGRDVTVSKA